MRVAYANLSLAVWFLLVSSSLNAEMLRVGVVGAPPYVVYEESIFSGISVDIWNLVASNLKLTSQFQYFSDLNSALELLKKHDIDVLVGPVPISSTLLGSFNLTEPYHRASLGLALESKDVSTWSRLKTQLYGVLGIAIFTFLLGLVVSFCIWRLERHRNHAQFAMQSRKGIADAMWFAVVTMMGVGYGDKVPVSAAGRSLAAVWMIISIMMFSSITAGITAFFTVSGIQHTSLVDAQLLKNSHVAVANTVGASVAVERFSAQPRMVQNLDEAFTLLERGDVKGIIADRVEMLYYVRQHPVVRAIVSDANYDLSYYGFALPFGEQRYLNQINVELFKLIESGAIGNVMLQWTHHRLPSELL